MEKETDITKAILKDLRAMGVFCFKHWGGPMGTKGVSDILGVLPGGRFLALEVKTGKGSSPRHRLNSFSQWAAGAVWQSYRGQLRRRGKCAEIAFQIQDKALK